ncbi:MAG: PAQR family membrane homeostasis protein TrhA [Ktedonobacterales bacterium]
MTLYIVCWQRLTEVYKRVLGQENDVRERATPLQWAPIEPLESRKPLLRGWFHAIACCGAVAFTILIPMRSQPRAFVFAPLLYGLSMIELYAVSATFHLGTWRKDRHRALRSLDHASIFVAIASTVTAVCAGISYGWGRTTLLVIVWVLALAGAVLAVRFPRVSRTHRTALYVGIGWIAALVLPALWTTLPHVAAGLLALGGLCYLAGSLVYLRRAPDPLPRVLGYHEIFHVLVIVGNALCAVVVWSWILPVK